MSASFMFTLFAIVYLIIALTLVPVPLAAGFFLVCFGGTVVKAIHARIELLPFGITRKA